MYAIPTISHQAIKAMRRKVFHTGCKRTLDESWLRANEIVWNTRKRLPKTRKDDFHAVLDINTARGGLLTNRLRPCSVPRSNLTQCYRLRIDDWNICPAFVGLPGWLKPFVIQQYQLGCNEDRLCSMFGKISNDLLSVIQAACTSVLLLLVERSVQTQANAKQCEYIKYDSGIPIEEEQWLFEGIGLSDDELETFESADFGILR